MADDIDTILAKYGENPRDGKVVWSVQGTRVISHKALERIASKAKIAFEKPTVLRAERDEAVILVAGSMDSATEWSIGEALVNDGVKVGNYKVSGKMAAYPYAMAEKRAKDRVILKLLNLHGQAYSEEEADDFKAVGEDKTGPAPAKTFVPAVSSAAIALGREIHQCKTLLDLNRLKKQPEFVQFWKDAHGEDRAHIANAADKRKAELDHADILQAGE